MTIYIERAPKKYCVTRKKKDGSTQVIGWVSYRDSAKALVEIHRKKDEPVVEKEIYDGV